MVKGNIADPATTEWASLIVFALTKDAGLRFCVQYQKLNAATVRDSYLIPQTDECIDSLGTTTEFSTLDVSSGY